MNQKLHVNKTDFDSERLRTRTHFETEAKGNSETLDLFHSVDVLFPKCFQSISRIFTYHGKNFHTMELDFFQPFSTMFPKYFHTMK